MEVDEPIITPKRLSSPSRQILVWIMEILQYDSFFNPILKYVQSGEIIVRVKAKSIIRNNYKKLNLDDLLNLVIITLSNDETIIRYNRLTMSCNKKMLSQNPLIQA